MANWRILLAILFLVWLIKNPKNTSMLYSMKVVKKKVKSGFFVILFLIIGALSLFTATDIVVGIKKILFLINIFLLFVIVKDVGRDKIKRLKIIKAGAVAGIISLIIGYFQLILIFLTPLYNFWQLWARNIISVFYGINLSKLLAVSNTWFSYYPDNPPTLRMFSVFPDSHSFALFTIISLIFFVVLLLSNKQKSKFWFIIILSFSALVFSGSRGIWLSALIPFGIILVLFIYKNVGHSTSHINVGSRVSHIIRFFISFLLIFIVAFPISSLVLSQSRQDGANGTLAFKRAKSVIDMDELSVKSRVGIWKTSFQSVLNHPMLGVGIGNYPVVLDEDISSAKKGASAHNLYLDVASEMGLLGLIVLLLIFWQILKIAVISSRHRTFPIIFIFFFLWILAYNLFDVVLLNDKVLLLFMTALGLLCSIYPQNNLANKQIKNE